VKIGAVYPEIFQFKGPPLKIKLTSVKHKAHSRKPGGWLEVIHIYKLLIFSNNIYRNGKYINNICALTQ